MVLAVEQYACLPVEERSAPFTGVVGIEDMGVLTEEGVQFFGDLEQELIIVS